MAYLSPSYLQGDELAQWESEGARLLARAPRSWGWGRTPIGRRWRARRFSTVRASETQRRRILERAYELTDDATQREEEILRRLASLRGEAAAEKAKKNAQRLREHLARRAALRVAEQNPAPRTRCRRVRLLGFDASSDAVVCAGVAQLGCRALS